jgi:glutamate/tyrosine decarboxylase-like PLP-dependent enzyme
MRNPMFEFDQAMTELIFDYCRERLALDPVELDFGGVFPVGFADRLDGVVNPEGNDAAEVLRLFAEVLAPAVISVDSPRYLSFIPAAPTKASLLFDMVVSCSSLNGTSWLEAAGAVAAENQVLRYLADRAGLPPTAGGCFVSGGSLGNLSALVVARDTAGERGKRLEGRRPRVAVSQEAHSSIAGALNIIGADALPVPVPDHRLTGEALRAALDAEDSLDDVVAVVGTAGTTNAGIIDDLRGIGEVAAERGLWFHVDGAYGGAGLLADALRPRYDGIELADSLIVDPHKWLFAPFDSCALLYRHPPLAKAVLAQHAGYLDVIQGEEWNPSDYSVHLTRRARGLPMWFSLAVNGTDAYGRAIEQAVATAHACAARIEAIPHLELLRRPDLSVVLFRRRGWTAEEYRAWTVRLLAEQVAFVTMTVWEGEPAARFAILHPDSTPAVLDEILATLA